MAERASASGSAAAAEAPDGGSAVPVRVRRRLGTSARRALAGLGGLGLAAGSVAGFWATAAAFDERIPVVAAARDLPRGHVLAAGDVAPALVWLDGVPHIEWTPDAPAALAGLALGHAVAGGSLLSADALAEPSAGAFGDALEVVVPVDTSLAPPGVADGETVLLIDPGVAPSRERAGRPRRVIRALELDGFDGAAMRLFVPPAEWVWWRALPAELGAVPMVLPVPLGGDPESLAAELDALWAAGFEAESAALSPFGGRWDAAASPGRLEAVVGVDLALAPSGVAQGDTVLLVDPGAPRGTAGGGRPRAVLRVVRLDHYADGVIGVWAGPDEWVWWRSLPGRLGAAPMVLRVPDGSDADAMAADLNEQWRQAWDQHAAQEATG